MHLQRLVTGVFPLVMHLQRQVTRLQRLGLHLRRPVAAPQSWESGGLTQRIERGFHRGALGLPLGEALLMLLQHLRRNLLREVRVGQLLLDLGNLRVVFLELLGEPRLLGGQFLRAAQTFQRQK